MRRQRLLKAVDHRNQCFNQPRGRRWLVFRAFFLDSLLVIIEVRLPPQQRLSQIVQVRGQFRHVRICRNVVLLRVGVSSGCLVYGRFP